MRYYYTDGIKAAYMAREFNFQMQVRVLKDFDSVEYVDKILNLDCAPMDIWWMQNFPPKLCKYFIHPDCHDMLKPQVGDLVEVDIRNFGNIVPCYITEIRKKKSTVRKCLNVYEKVNEEVENSQIGNIIQRNGIAFFMPEREE